MIKVAEWGKLSYYLKEQPSDEPIVVVQDNTGKQATFLLETAEILSQESGFTLVLPAKTTIHEFKNEFLSYWEECRMPLEGNFKQG